MPSTYITLAQIATVTSANDLLEAIYPNINTIELPINIDYIASCIEKVKVSNDLNFEHLDKAGLIQVLRDETLQVNNINIWVNPLELDTRQRFTQAHELGHLVYDISPALNNPNLDEEFIDVLHRQEGVRSFKETRANRFAAQLLMPATLVKREVLGLVEQVKAENTKISKDEVITRLSGIFNTSKEAMTYRLEDLHII
ncbi:ImmA/IrrE family metallo-endopeptidase [Photobacterium kishitanii]|uniref:ImmA/IrrE family metallo-endopeptidase n=1 Tax=Photobacterium kishitanii TaxID=318456 RepID=UPI002738679F|nr:ImmA/IrrE family metallo-endopeptidase [Photobacterium kishitanii]